MLCALVQLVPLLAVQALHLSVLRHRQAALSLNIFLDQHVLQFQPHVLQVPSTQLPLLQQLTVYVQAVVQVLILRTLRRLQLLRRPTLARLHSQALHSPHFPLQARCKRTLCLPL